MKQVRAYTDGACSGNPGPGGWGVVLESHGHTRELLGAQEHTTNNRMELQAAIEALNSLTEPCEVEVVTDSTYLKNGMQSWLVNWKRKGWKTSEGKPVKNQDLWRQLDALVATHRVHWHWVRGHTGVEGNERADALANEAIARMLES
ncbi:MAG: ribonuclease HI [Gammaproteobacteria bacterium]|nr:ribonuclease HI [Gammaproteobacteria bacterium]